MKDQFPLRILFVEQGEPRFRATTSVARLGGASPNLRPELGYLAEDYTLLIRSLREHIAAASRSTKVDPRIYWLVGDHIIRFLERLDDLGFYLVQQNATFARDLGLSATSIKKVLSFRRRYVRVSQVDPSIPWNRYRENKVLSVL